MFLEIRIDTSNSEMEKADHAVAVLRKIVDRLQNEMFNGTDGPTRINDGNGNKVGTWEFRPTFDPDELTRQIAMWIVNDYEALVVARKAFRDRGSEGFRVNVQNQIKFARHTSGAFYIRPMIRRDQWDEIDWEDIQEQAMEMEIHE